MANYDRCLRLGYASHYSTPEFDWGAFAIAPSVWNMEGSTLRHSSNNNLLYQLRSYEIDPIEWLEKRDLITYRIGNRAMAKIRWNSWRKSL